MIHNTVKSLALSLPGFGQIDNPPGLVFSGDKANLGTILSGLLNIAFYIAVFLSFYFLVWGVFQYILSSGNKEELGKARARITWALVGLVIIMLAFLLTKFASEIFPPGQGGIPF